MTKSPPAFVDSALLRWARTSARITTTEVAARLKLGESKIEAWESGTDRPSIAQLRKVAEVYRRPLAVFFLAEPPKDFEALRDFRRTDADSLAISPELEDDLRRAQEIKEAAVSLLEESEIPRSFLVSASLADDPEDVAARLREALGVGYDAQLGWKDSYEALRAWREAVEDLGALVINMKGVKINDARGFSIAEPPLPLIALNAKDTANGRLFTLMHELSHVALHDGGICDYTPERKLAPSVRRVETFCNEVAASVLMPRELILSVLENGPRPARDKWPDELLRAYSRMVCISEEAFLLRLVSLGLASESFYASKRIEYQRRYAEAAKKTSKPIVTYEKRVVGQLGAAYLDIAFSAYYSRRLTLSELSSYTGVRVTNLGNVEREAFGFTRVPGVAK